MLRLGVVCCLFLLWTWPAVVTRTTLGLTTVTAVEAQESVTVWVNTRSGVYHCPGSRYYGNTKAGEFMLETEARAAGNRPAYGQTCGPGTAAARTTESQPLRLAAPESVAVAGVKVWVNTKSGVYHCPGSRYYGKTKTGRFMSEREARAAGKRPAYGQACS